MTWFTHNWWWFIPTTLVVAWVAFMMAILHVPIAEKWVIPNWARYVGYAALFLAFFVIWDDGTT
jgi:hypothetical protein